MINCKNLLALVLCVSGITGCCTPKPIPPAIVKIQIQKVKVPAEYLIIPDPVPSIDLVTATQKNVALLIVGMDERMKTLVSKLQAIKTFNDE